MATLREMRYFGRFICSALRYSSPLLLCVTFCHRRDHGDRGVRQPFISIPHPLTPITFLSSLIFCRRESVTFLLRCQRICQEFVRALFAVAVDHTICLRVAFRYAPQWPTSTPLCLCL